MPDDDAFSYDYMDGRTYAFLQWKNTNACFDFYCKCGAHCHFDGYFAHYVKCPHCSVIYRMPFNLFPKEVSDTDGAEPKVMEPDEDYSDEILGNDGVTRYVAHPVQSK